MSFEIGKPISKEMRVYLKGNLSMEDRANIAVIFSISPSTIRNLINREAAVSQEKLPFINECLRKAIENARDKIKDYREAKEYMEMESKMAEKDSNET